MRYLLILVFVPLLGCAGQTIHFYDEQGKITHTVEQRLRFQTGVAGFSPKGKCQEAHVAIWDKKGTLVTDGEVGHLAQSMVIKDDAKGCAILRATGLSNNTEKLGAAAAGAAATQIP